MAKRKTVSVAWLLHKANTFNRLSTGEDSKGFRMGHNSFISTILQETGNYAGFRYLVDSEVPVGEKPGMVLKQEGNEFPDESRREYYVSRHIYEDYKAAVKGDL